MGRGNTITNKKLNPWVKKASINKANQSKTKGREGERTSKETQKKKTRKRKPKVEGDFWHPNMLI